MSEKFTWQIWSQPDLPGSQEESVREKMVVTCDSRTLARIVQALRMAHYHDYREWINFYGLEVDKPIRSRENPILADFRSVIENAINPYLPKEAAWWLTLIERDPLMERIGFWDDTLVDSVGSDLRVIDQAVRVLTRLKNRGMV